MLWLPRRADGPTHLLLRVPTRSPEVVLFTFAVRLRADHPQMTPHRVDHAISDERRLLMRKPRAGLYVTLDGVVDTDSPTPTVLENANADVLSRP